jgi:ABC-type molybdate transport system permease subunit
MRQGSSCFFYNLQLVLITVIPKSATHHGIYNVLAHLLILSPTASGFALIVKMTPVHQ